MFRDSLNAAHTAGDRGTSWCVHVLSVMKGYQAILNCTDTLENSFEPQLKSAFEMFMQKQYKDNRPCFLLRTWGSKNTYFVLCPDSVASAHGVSRHSTCTIHQATSSQHCVYCSDVLCRKTKNKKKALVNGKTRAGICCHLQLLFESLQLSEDMDVIPQDVSDEEIDQEGTNQEFFFQL